MELLMDVVPEPVIPYLIHFGEEGISPRVLDVDEPLVFTNKIEGYYLWDELIKGITIPILSEIYAKLRRKVGYISKYSIVHGDLHLNNIVVDCENNPFLFDWDRSSHLGIIDEGFWIQQNASDILKGTLENIDYGLYRKLERIFLGNFRDEIFTSQEISPRDIQMKSLELYGI